MWLRASRSGRQSAGQGGTLFRSALAGLTAWVAVAVAGQARCETAEEFFRGKQLSLIIGYNPGGSYDAYGRIGRAHV